MRRKVNIFVYTAVCYSLLLFAYTRLRGYSGRADNVARFHGHDAPEEARAHELPRDLDGHLNAKRRLAESQNVSPETTASNSCEISQTVKNACTTLAEGRTEMVKMFTRIYKEETQNKAQCDVNVLVNVCEYFLQSQRYYQIPLTEEEVEFPLAFAVKVIDELEQTLRLLRTIYRPNNVYCIHVDENAPDKVVRVIEKVGVCLENVIVIQDRVRIVHASNSNVRAELKCMNAVMESRVKWKYYINLEPSEFPLRTNFEMVEILRFVNDANDIETYDHPIFLNWRVDHEYSVNGNSVAQESKKTPLKSDIRISKGSPYGLFSRKFVHFVAKDKTARYVIDWFNNTYMPEENVLATLVTLPEAPGGYSDEVRHMTNTFMARALVVSGDQQRCYGKFENTICILGLGDIHWVTKRPEFFAHKFNFESGVLDCMEEWYREKAMGVSSRNLDWKFYLNLQHLKSRRK